MVVIVAYFRLIRIQILLLIAAIQIMVRYFIIDPMLSINGYAFVMTDSQFAMLVIATVLISAGGFSINNYFDAKLDRINKPKTVIVGRLIKRRVAMANHVVLTSLGLLLASYLSWQVGMWKLTSLFVLASFGLWYYSTNLKHSFLAGNVVIALLAGFTSLIVGLFEIPLQNELHPEVVEELGYSIFNVPAFWIIGFSSILFSLTLIREITKDVIDIRGDKALGSQTIPIQLGIRNTKSILIILYAAFGAAYAWVHFRFLHVHLGMTTVFYIVNLLLVLQIILIFRSRTKKHFRYSANLNNLISLIFLGSLYLIKVSIETYFS